MAADQKGSIRKIQVGIAIITVVAIGIGALVIWNSPPSPELDAKITSTTIQLNNAAYDLIDACHDRMGNFMKTDSSCIEGTLSIEASCKTTDQRYVKYMTICDDPRFKSAVHVLKG